MRQVVGRVGRQQRKTNWVIGQVDPGDPGPEYLGLQWRHTPGAVPGTYFQPDPPRMSRALATPHPRRMTPRDLRVRTARHARQARRTASSGSSHQTRVTPAAMRCPSDLDRATCFHAAVTKGLRPKMTGTGQCASCVRSSEVAPRPCRKVQQNGWSGLAGLVWLVCVW